MVVAHRCERLLGEVKVLSVAAAPARVGCQVVWVVAGARVGDHDHDRLVDVIAGIVPVQL